MDKKLETCGVISHLVKLQPSIVRDQVLNSPFKKKRKRCSVSMLKKDRNFPCGECEKA